MAETVKLADEATAHLPEGYKVTDLGPLPEEWQVVKLESIFDVVNKKAREVRINSDERYLLLTVRLYAKGVTARGIAIGSKIGVSKLYRTEDDDFVFSKIDARNGAWGFIPPELAGGLVSNDFPILRLNESCALREFMELLLSQPKMWEPLRAIAVGTTNRRRIKPEHFFELKVPLPPISEQRAIAHVLSTVRKALQASEKVLAAARELKTSLMRHLFTYGPVPVNEIHRIPLVESEIGPIPAHWRVVRLGDIGKVITGRTPSTSCPKYWNGSIPFITPVDLKGGPVRVAQRSITEEGLREAKALPKGSVLVSCIGHIGKVGVVDADVAASNQQINAVICQNADNWFVAYAIMHNVPLLESFARMTTIPILSKRNLERVPIPFPPPSEQREIASMLREVDRKIEAEEARLQALDTLYKTLLHLLMSGRVRVKQLTSAEGRG